VPSPLTTIVCLVGKSGQMPETPAWVRRVEVEVDGA
jgi:hypothetical protein